MDHWRSIAAVVAAATIAWAAGLAAQPSPPAHRQAESNRRPQNIAAFRRPIALAWADDGRILLAANRRSGTVSAVNVARRTVIDEFPISDQLADWKSMPDGKHFAAVDDLRKELIVARWRSPGRIEVVGRTPIGRDPIGVAVSHDGRFAAVARRWSRRLDLVTLLPDKRTVKPGEVPTTWSGSSPQLVKSWLLPFATREALFLPGDERIVVVDAFGGGLALVDPHHGDEGVATYRIDGHNLRGLTCDDERRELLFMYQHLDQHLPTTAENIAACRLLSNRLRRIPIADLFAADKPTALPGRDVPLDRGGRGTADPQDAALLADGRVLIALGGSQQLGTLAADESRMVRVKTGSRPTAVAVDQATCTAYVADQLDDSVSVIDLDRGERVDCISLGPQPEPYPHDRGERLFFDARSSPGGFLSCHSCHSDGHTNGLLADTLGDGTYGTPKRVLTLLGTALTDNWAWSGQVRELREQVRQSFETTMHVPSLMTTDHDDVAAFLHTLPFPGPSQPPPDEAPEHRDDRSLWERGRAVFEHQGCGACHVPPLTYTSHPAFDVGLSDEKGMSKFNPPSLRGVGQNSAFLHDGRAASLEAVFRDEGHQLTDELRNGDLPALLRFLHSL